MTLSASGPIVSTRDGQVIQNKSIQATDQPGITILHHNVRVYNCSIRHGVSAADQQSPGIVAQGVANPDIYLVDIAQRLPLSKNSVNPNLDNILLDGCYADPNNPSPAGIVKPTIRSARVQRGSRLINIVQCLGGGLIHNVEGHNVRGLQDGPGVDDFGGNFLQLNESPDWIVEDFSYEDPDSNGNANQSWTEDLLSVYHSDNVIVRRGILQRANSPSGDNFMNEGSANCQVSDVDAAAWSNGAFGFTSGGTGSLTNCRAKNGSLTGYDGRGAPTSNGLMIYVQDGPVSDRQLQVLEPGRPEQSVVGRGQRAGRAAYPDRDSVHGAAIHSRHAPKLTISRPWIAMLRGCPGGTLFRTRMRMFPKTIDLEFCRLRFFEWGVETEFKGSEAISSNWPHLQDENWMRIVGEAGYADPLAYVHEHDFFHAFLAQAWFHKPSYVLWQAAHNLPIDENASAWEERMIFDVQRAYQGIGLAPSTWTQALVEARALLGR